MGISQVALVCMYTHHQLSSPINRGLPAIANALSATPARHTPQHSNIGLAVLPRTLRACSFWRLNACARMPRVLLSFCCFHHACRVNLREGKVLIEGQLNIVGQLSLDMPAPEVTLCLQYLSPGSTKAAVARHSAHRCLMFVDCIGLPARVFAGRGPAPLAQRIRQAIHRAKQRSCASRHTARVSATHPEAARHDQAHPEVRAAMSQSRSAYYARQAWTWPTGLIQTQKAVLLITHGTLLQAVLRYASV